MMMHVPPECQGQMVECAYGYDYSSNRLWERRRDRSDGSTTWRSAPCPDEQDLDMWNHAPDILNSEWRDEPNGPPS